MSRVMATNQTGRDGAEPEWLFPHLTRSKRIEQAEAVWPKTNY